MSTEVKLGGRSNIFRRLLGEFAILMNRERQTLIPMKDPQEYFEEKNWELYGDDYGALINAVRESGKGSVFEFAGVEDNLINRARFLGNYFHHHIRDLAPSAVDKGESPNTFEWEMFRPGILSNVEYDLAILFGGEEAESRDDVSTNPRSLSRHLIRSVSLSKILMEECFINNDIDIRDTVKMNNYGRETFGIPPVFVAVAAYFHDLPRYLDQSSGHDSYAKLLADQIGLLPIIPKAVYEIQPTKLLTQEEVRNYDTGAQKIVRLADLFGKLFFGPDDQYGYYISIDEVCERAADNQRRYYERENSPEANGSPNSFWRGKTIDELNDYIANERLLLVEAADWFEKTSGTSIERLMKDINSRTERYDQPD